MTFACAASLPNLMIVGFAATEKTLQDSSMETVETLTQWISADSLALFQRFESGHMLMRRENGFVLQAPCGLSLKVFESKAKVQGTTFGITEYDIGLEIIGIDGSIVDYDQSGRLSILHAKLQISIYGLN